MSSLSILTATYNRDSTLDRLFKSLCDQSNHEFEWIIVDDGSTDSTEEKVSAFKDTSPFKIKYKFQSNSGKHVAINTGVPLCEHEYIFIVDSDDALTNDATEIVKKGFEEYPNFSGYCYRKAYFDGKLIGKKTNLGVFTSRTQQAAKLFEGDLAYIFSKRALVENPFPVVPDEKFVPEALVWGKISDRTQILYFSEVPIYLCQYLPDGYTNNFKRNLLSNPRGFALFYKYDIFHGYGILRRIKSLIRYIQCCAYYSLRKLKINLTKTSLF